MNEKQVNNIILQIFEHLVAAAEHLAGNNELSAPQALMSINHAMQHLETLQATHNPVHTLAQTLYENRISNSTNTDYEYLAEHAYAAAQAFIAEKNKNSEL